MTKILTAGVGDWHDMGPLREVMLEDGPITVAPANQAVVVATTAHGHEFTHPHDFGTDFKAAQHFADKVRATGEIDPANWNEPRPIYGTQAWIDDDAEAHLVALEREEG